MKMSISLNDEIANKIQKYSKEFYMTKSGFISMCVNQYLAQKEAVDVLSQISDALERINKNGMDEETRKELSDFNTIYEAVSRHLK